MNCFVLYATLHYNKDDHFEGVMLICSPILVFFIVSLSEARNALLEIKVSTIHL